MELITCKNVSFGYDGIVAVENLNFSVIQDDYLCIVGENGAGKSTLIKGLLQLKKPRSGTIEMHINSNEIGYLPQQTIVQKDFPASVYEIVLSGCLNKLGFRPFYTKKERALVKVNLRRMGIENLSNRCYSELSGGQQQRVLLARALCSATKIILLDEPSAGLDPLVTQSFYELIRQINEELKIAVIMVSHDVNTVVKYTKHILHLHHQQLFYGTKEDYLKSELAKYLMGGF